MLSARRTAASETESQRFSVRRRTLAAAGVFVLALPLSYAAPATVAAPSDGPAVQATVVRAALTKTGGFDRPSSTRVALSDLEARAARTVVRASRDSIRSAPPAGAASMGRPTTARPKAAARAKPKPRAVWVDRWVRPGNGPLTSGYKQRWGRMHRGIDLAAPFGAPIVAAADGVVTYAGGMSGYGKLVLIRHKGGVVTAYGHMKTIKTNVGERVEAGDLIALVGSEGRSTGPHLHFEVRINGSHVNPQPFLAKRKVFL